MAAHLDQRQLERHNQSHDFHWPNLVLLLGSKVARTPEVIYNTQWGKQTWFSGVILLPMVCISAPWRLSLVTCTRRNYSVLARPSLGGSLACCCVGSAPIPASELRGFKEYSNGLR